MGTTDPAAPELPEEVKALLIEAVEFVGRCGATDVEFGYLDDDVPSAQARWWAKATFRGAVMFVEDQPGPIVALRNLANRLATGASCARCGRRIAWGGGNRRARRAGNTCGWHRVDGRWERGCL